VPFIRQTRDKRGFEHTYVMHTYHPGSSGSARPRVLYVFRSPANLRVGRQALDAEVMEALEHTHPDLSFDWGAIAREVAPPPRPEPPQDRHVRRPAPRAPERPPSRPPDPPAPSVAADDSLLGRTLGASTAARLRQRYRELTERVGRRARTPEERDRLLERLGRLNPEDWSDEATVRGQAASVDAAWNSIAAELPSRRRGRRGGRRQPEGHRDPSAIMDQNHAHATIQDAGVEREAAANLDSAARGDAGGSVGDAVRPADAAAEAPAAAPAGPEIPLGD